MNPKLIMEVVDQCVKERKLTSKLRWIIRHQLEQDQLKDKDKHPPQILVDKFLKFDIDESEYLDKYELRKLLQSEFGVIVKDKNLGPNDESGPKEFSKKEFEIIYKTIDLDLSGEISVFELFAFVFPELQLILQKQEKKATRKSVFSRRLSYSDSAESRRDGLVKTMEEAYHSEVIASLQDPHHDNEETRRSSLLGALGSFVTEVGDRFFATGGGGGEGGRDSISSARSGRSSSVISEPSSKSKSKKYTSLTQTPRSTTRGRSASSAPYFFWDTNRTQTSTEEHPSPGGDSESGDVDIEGTPVASPSSYVLDRGLAFASLARDEFDGVNPGTQWHDTADADSISFSPPPTPTLRLPSQRFHIHSLQLTSPPHSSASSKRNSWTGSGKVVRSHVGGDVKDSNSVDGSSSPRQRPLNSPLGGPIGGPLTAERDEDFGVVVDPEVVKKQKKQSRKISFLVPEEEMTKEDLGEEKVSLEMRGRDFTALFGAVVDAGARAGDVVSAQRASDEESDQALPPSTPSHFLVPGLLGRDREDEDEDEVVEEASLSSGHEAASLSSAPSDREPERA